MRVGLIFALALLAGGAQADSLQDYIEAAFSRAGLSQSALSECDCLYDAVAVGNCTAVCDQTTCSTFLGDLVACGQNECPNGNICIDAIDVAKGVICSLPFVNTMFPPGTPVCNASAATYNYLIDSWTLQDDIRSKCETLNPKIASGGCANACTATSCANYLAELQICAKQLRDFDCFIAINTLRFHIQNGVLDCHNYNFSAGACHLQFSTPGFVNLTVLTFDDLLPRDVRMVIGPQAIAACSCLKSNLTNCGICDITDSCDFAPTLHKCAENTAACDGTECGSYLDQVSQLFLNRTCFAIDDGEFNCTSGDELQIFECTDPFPGASCPTLLKAVLDDDDVPIFVPVPTPTAASVSISPSVSRSRRRGAGALQGPSVLLMAVSSLLVWILSRV